jgi:DnaJ-domain-containing protein 1
VESLLALGQDIRQRAKEAKTVINAAQQMVSKLNHAQHKLQEIEEELATDEESEKRELVSQLNNRIGHSLKALKIHSECYKRMMAATIRASGARLNQEVAADEERLTR